MDPNNIVCPVCTLYLRPGITLKSHLASHPKQKIIEALVTLSDTTQKVESISAQNGEASTSSTSVSPQNTVIANNTCGVETLAPATSPATVAGVQGNHVFIYQQSMSATGSQSNVLNVNPLSQQYVIPAVFNSQMMPYVYQQQQVIMSSGACVPSPIRALPFGLPSTSEQADSSPGQTCIITETNEENDLSSNNAHTPICQLVELNDLKKPNDGAEHIDKKEIVEHQLEKAIKIDSNLIVTEEVDTVFNDASEDYNDNEQECVTSPGSNVSDWSLKIRTDLNKACQTHNSNNLSPRSFVQEDETILENIDNVENIETVEPEYYFPGDIPPHTSTVSSINGQTYSHTENIYSTSNMLHSGENLDFVEMDGMQVIINGFSTNHVISQVENFDNTKPERPGVLMTIGGMVEASRDISDRGESFSHDGANVDIRADEPMPARGELSGQESMGGASDITWNRMHYNEPNSTVSSSYDLMPHESWEASNGSDIDANRLQSQTATQDSYLHDLSDGQNVGIDEDVPAIVGFIGPPLNFKCSTCGEAFACLQDRKDHELEKHPEKKKQNLIGSEIGKKKVKRLVVKLKQDKTETENNFDNVFTNKLKIEPPTDVEHKEATPSSNEQAAEMKNDSASVDLKVVCSICDGVLPHAKALKIHKMEVHNVAPDVRHKCASCGEAFPNDYKYTEHLKIHPLECRLCGKLFYRRQNIQLHMKRHLGIKPYKCEICEKSFLTKQKHDEHKNVHTGESPIKCTMCDETFKRHSNLVQHRNRHHFNFKRKIRDYICFCGEIFHSKKKLAWHKEIHDAKPKACSQCSEKFIHMSSLTRHMRRAHNERFLPKEGRNQENVECPICKGVYLRSSLEVHIRNHSGQRPYTCTICNKDFTTKWNLKLHKWTHASRTSKPFKCEQCKGAFIREADYTAHMNSHKSIRPYTCNYCGAQFIRKYNCQRHVKEHENGKMFNCQICGKSFHRSYYLKDHMRVHSGARPYSCHVCGKTSATKSNHNKHVQIHHAREPVNTEH